MADRRRDRLPAHDPRATRRSSTARRGVPGRRLAGRAPSDGDEVTIVAAGITLHEALAAADALAGRGHRRARDRPLLGQADRRGHAARGGRGDRRAHRHRRGPLAGGRPRRRGARGARRRRSPGRASSTWPCATCRAPASRPSCSQPPGSTPTTSRKPPARWSKRRSARAEPPLSARPFCRLPELSWLRPPAGPDRHSMQTAPMLRRPEEARSSGLRHRPARDRRGRQRDSPHESAPRHRRRPEGSEAGPAPRRREPSDRRRRSARPR